MGFWYNPMNGENLQLVIGCRMKLTLVRLDLQTLRHEIGEKNEKEEIDRVVKYQGGNLIK
jgi:hypothetical protein